MTRSNLKLALRWTVSLGMIVLVLAWVEPSRVLAELGNLDARWFVLALTVSVAQVGLSAWRWQFTARRLGLDLTWRQAFSNYYLASLINQVLPGGVVGDAWRAHRHGRHSGQRGRAWRAVIIERASGQLAVIALTATAVAMVPGWHTVLTSFSTERTMLVLLLVITAGIGLVGFFIRHWPEVVRAVKNDTHLALLARKAWPVQLISSLLIVFSYALVFALTARGIGLDLDFWLLLTLAMPVLLAMLVPLTVAGWGIREAAAAGIWLSLGMNPEQGVAVALAYGLVILVAALPGLVVMTPGTTRQSETCSEVP